MTEISYKVKSGSFEGPLEVLLNLIEKKEAVPLETILDVIKKAIKIKPEDFLYYIEKYFEKDFIPHI